MTVDAAWADFHDRMTALGARITDADFPDDPRHRAEGFRYLARLTVFALQLYLELSDPEHPAFLRFGDDVVKWGATNADNQYLRAAVAPDGVYRISGDVADVREALISIHDGEMVLGHTEVLSEAALTDLTIGPDGAFDLVVGGQEVSGNWMPLAPSAAYLLVRQFVADWEHDAVATLTIERIDERGQLPPAAPTAHSVATALGAAATFVERSVEFWHEYTTMMRAVMVDNQLTAPARPQGGAENMLSGGGIWNLDPGEALFIECAAPQAAYWSIQLYDLAWFESLDFVNRVTSLNGEQLHVDADGRIRIAIAHEDPGIPNWLDTSGYPSGLVAYRFVHVTDAPTPTAELVPVAEVAARLPAGSVAFTAADRHAQIGRRRRGVARRFRR